jgi:3-oxoacyl-[acyl-carrier protein] reductase
MKTITIYSILLNLLIIEKSLISVISMSMSMSLAGKKVLVTGGGRGIGRAIAHICAQEGAHVAICSRTKSELEETAAAATAIATSTAKGSGTLIPMEIFETDLCNKNQVESMVDTLVNDRWGGNNIDILINNAGSSQRSKGLIHTLDGQDLEDLLNINVVSVHTVTSTVLRKCMKKDSGNSSGNADADTDTDTNNQNIRGRIINISSRAAKKGIPNMSFYVTSKFALEGYSATLATELKDDNIVVNTISPGMVNTKSFPKDVNRKGVRTAESIKDALLLLLNVGIEKTGHYLHVDELDMVRAKRLDDSLALKPIDEPDFTL